MIKVGIVGSGFGVYGLVPAFSSLAACELVALCAKKNERTLAACKKYQIPQLYSNWEEMLENEKLDAIVIAVIPSAQYKICLAAIKKRLHIFAEKPLAVNLSQAKKLLKLAEKEKITHTVDFIFAEIPAFLELKRMVSQQEFGKINRITLNWDFLSYDIKNKQKTWKTDLAQGGGALAFYFSHCLYYLEWLFGPMSILKSSFSYAKESLNHAEVGVDLKLAFKNGISGTAHISCNNRSLQEHKLSVFGEKKKAVLVNNTNIFDQFVLNKNYQISLHKNKFEDDRVVLVSRIAQRFINSCHQKKQMLPSFREGLRVQELIAEIREKNAQKK